MQSLVGVAGCGQAFLTHRRQAVTLNGVEMKLARNEAHVWRIEIDQASESLFSLIDCLSEEEQARAARYRFADDRLRHQVGRGALRRLLAGYLQKDAKAISFISGRAGKPELPGDLRFNLSHSGRRVLIAFSVDRVVGVDVEQIRPMPNAAELANRYFAGEEVAAWRKQPEEDRLPAFFRCWTRKEAFIKATGDGLGYGLDRFAVTLARDEPARFLHIQQCPEETSRWSLHDVPMESGYLAALAGDGPMTVRVFDWVRSSNHFVT